MIPNKGRERKNKSLKMSKNVERLCREAKCRGCSVIVTRMDFAKILGKFNKVKIQYENSTNVTKSSTKQSPATSPNSSRLKSNENGMVMLHRNAYNKHPVKAITSKGKKKEESGNQPVNNILKENNRIKKTPVIENNIDMNIEKSNVTRIKRYGIVFDKPPSNNNNKDIITKPSLGSLLLNIDLTILPSQEWFIDYFPKEDKVYDRIAAELEDLMYNEKSDKTKDNVVPIDNKVDEFPSIMDILNDNVTQDTLKENSSQVPSVELKSNLESSDVEAMLLGKTNGDDKSVEAMDVDNSEITNLLDDNVISEVKEDTKESENIMNAVENPQSPSILDEALQKGIEEHLPAELPDKDTNLKDEIVDDDKANCSEITKQIEEATEEDKKVVPEIDLKTEQKPSLPTLRPDAITHVVFKKTVDGKCIKSVTCPKNLKYTIELEDKPVELIGAPKHISSLEDLQILLQIVNECQLSSSYVMH